MNYLKGSWKVIVINEFKLNMQLKEHYGTFTRRLTLVLAYARSTKHRTVTVRHLKNWHSSCSVFGIFDGRTGRCSNRSVFRLFSVWQVRCLDCSVFGLFGVRTVRCSDFSVFRLFDVRTVRCLNCSVFGLFGFELIGVWIVRCSDCSMSGLSAQN